MSDGTPSITLRELTDRRHARPALVLFLRELHESAFPPAEQQFTTEFMLEHTGRNGYRLLLIEVDHDVAGYLFVRVNEERQVGYLWYMAIAPAFRGCGYGGETIRRTIELLRGEHRSLRVLLLESHRPDGGDAEHDSAIDRRRIAFYKRLGARQVGGIDYGMPAANDPTRVLHYVILFFDLGDGADRDFVREQIAFMLRANFPEGDERLVAMLASLADLTVDSSSDA